MTMQKQQKKRVLWVLTKKIVAKRVISIYYTEPIFFIKMGLEWVLMGSIKSQNPQNPFFSQKRNYRIIVLIINALIYQKPVFFSQEPKHKIKNGFCIFQCISIYCSGVFSSEPVFFNFSTKKSLCFTVKK